MEVAIMGAGISGLSCAITLERHGITPTIFEKRSSVGDRFVNGEAMFSIFNRPVKDSISYLSENYHIKLKPIDEVEKLFIHSKNKIGAIEGEIGYTNVRGRHIDSFENQLRDQVKANINYNSTCEYQELCKNFDYVVLATGDGEYASRLDNYNNNLTCSIKGVTVQGEFVTSNPHVFFNYDIVSKGYGWLIPFSAKEANLVMAYPDYPENIKLDVNDIWEKYYNLVCKSLDQNFKVTDNFEITKYMMGICNKAKIDNTYFVGNCFGAISPGMGFGQYTSILTGIYSGQDICGIGNYEELTKPLFENYNHSLVLRKFIEDLSDDKLDNVVKSLDSKVVGKLVDAICSNKNGIEILKLATPTMRIMNKI
ncbi:NAD(P)/FAD-dependent oxidoreductase [Clostridium sp. CS001]|uniref:NAD(P)/FAD-dependent oxidoreductase n=1 Tax=Clostridium sp. CS001 TaxID=2880648 RepID=UPI001CF57C5D|nr:NAD(P)/FAD-dependent oxidoreductase [Clostridium sp. CS001]MCB2289786.1 NAD(P)/FAD-dependent oxidoreductase [Clostridium sp. CS001]